MPGLRLPRAGTRKLVEPAAKLASAAGERYDRLVISSIVESLAARKMSWRLVVAAAGILVALLPLRAEPVDVGFQGAEIDLLPLAEKVQEFSPEATVELPATGSTPSQTIALNALGPGPLYRWAIFTLHNPEGQPRELVISASHQRFVASQVLWPLPEGSRVVGLATSDGTAVQPLTNLGADSFAVTVAPGATMSYVLEVSPTGLDSLSLWHRDAFHAMADRYAFFRGLVLGISILLGISFICLFILRPQAAFPAAALFGWSAIAFLVIEAGYLPAVLAKLPALSGSEQELRAVTEAMMLAGVIAMLVSFLELRRRMPRVGMVLVAGGAASAALALYGWFEPRLALGLTRMLFAVVVAGGFGLVVVLWQRGAVRAQAALLGWTVLTAWTAAAALGVLGLVDGALMHPLISAGLVLVLVTLGFTLAQLAFGFGPAAGAAFEEADRRALALIASDQAVWDWQVDQGELHVGPEIERALGVEEGACCDSAGWLDLIHPADRAAYGVAIEGAVRRGRGSFSHEFRLRRADGSYLWYVLRARAMPGGSDGAGRLIGTLADVTMLRRSEDRLLADAVRDRLTGLPNRALFLDRLEQAMARGRITDAGLYVIALDLDRFKSFNDGLGAEAGDFLLTTVGRRLLGCIGPADTLARLPGHQFGIIWTASPHASDIANLTAAMGAAVVQPIYLPAGEVIITASMGVARVHHEYRRADAVLKDAEIALYEAKRQGYGAVEFFRPDMHDERSALLRMEQNLRHALERNEIEVVYQPIIRLDDRKLAGFEALMRWRRDDLVLEPDSFVGLAEETGIIRELGSYVLKEATSRLGTWQRTFRPQEPLFVAVNISSVQLLNGDLIEDIQRLMEREELRPGSLKLELTESLVVENPELAHKLLMRLKQMGVALSCDDFGTGYSGLESVFRLPFDSVKIDRVFLEGERGDRNWIMVEAMLRLARDLGLDVVAEGIETAEQMERLIRLGCDFGQGYLIGPPVTAQQVVEAFGGLSSGAKWPGAGLAAFWTRLTGRKEAEADRPVTRSRQQARVAPDGARDVTVAKAAAAAAPKPVEEPKADPVIEVRPVVPPDSKPPAPRPPQAPTLAPPPPPPAVPSVGSAPFAPRKMPSSKPPEVHEPGQAEITLSVAPMVELQQPPATAQESPAIEPEPAEDTLSPVLEPEAGAASAVESGNGRAPGLSEARLGKREKRKVAQSPGANPLQRKERRVAESGQAKTGQAKTGQAKSGQAKSGQAKSGQAKSGQAKSGQAKIPGQVKAGRVKSGRAKPGPATSTRARNSAVKDSPAKQ